MTNTSEKKICKNCGTDHLDRRLVCRASDIIALSVGKERERIFNLKKGATLYIPKRDGTEQVWKCVEIRKWK